jgi:hypothetical protein
MTRELRLTPTERGTIYERRIRQDVLTGLNPSSAPATMIIAGPPGAGVAFAAALLRRDLAKTAGPAAHLSAERLAAYHPLWQEPRDRSNLTAAATVKSVADEWVERLVVDARAQRLNMVIEMGTQDPRSISRMIPSLRKDGYAVQAVFLGTNRDESRVAAMTSYAIWRARDLPTAFVTIQEHDAAFSGLRAAMGLLEDRRSVDGLRLILRDGSQIYENRLVNGEWARPPRAQATLDIQHDRARPPRELVNLVMRWETLVRRLDNDPEVPRDAVSQALVWRNEAVAQCEGTPAAAQMLQWAREAIAFRTMDRFQFEKEFPHHARAANLLGLAVIEAEKYSAKEGARMLFHTRENIALRIERGDMARIAAREKSIDPPTR